MMHVDCSQEQKGRQAGWMCTSRRTPPLWSPQQQPCSAPRVRNSIRILGPARETYLYSQRWSTAEPTGGVTCTVWLQGACESKLLV